jgi:hypothetical protein
MRIPLLLAGWIFGQVELSLTWLYLASRCLLLTLALGRISLENT